MFQKVHIPTALLFGGLAAVAFAIPMFYFVSSAKYADSWWLYMGNFMFLIMISIYMVVLNRRKSDNVNTSLSLVAGHVVTVIGVVIACILSFLALMILVPGFFGNNPQVTLENVPTQADNGRTDGLALLLFMNAIIGNVSAGSFASIILAYTMKRDQTKERVIGGVNVDTR